MNSLHTGLESLREELVKRFSKVELLAENSDAEIEKKINASHKGLQAFQITLKEEIDRFGEQWRRGNLENISAIQNNKLTIQKLKEAATVQIEQTNLIKETISASINH